MSGAFRLRRVWAVARTEGLHVLRDWSALSLIMVLPIFQVLLYGSAINLQPEHTRLAVAGDVPSSEARIVAWAHRQSIVQLIGPAGPPGSAEAAVRQGRASIGLEVSQGPFGAVGVHAYADGADPATVRPALAAMQAGYWRRLSQSDQTVDADAETEQTGPEVTYLFNPDQRASWAVAPGLSGVIVMVSMLFLGAMCLVRERERGSWETLLATPVRPAEALIGKLSPYVLIGTLEILVLFGVVHLVFGVPLPGATWALIAAAPLYVTSYLLMGFTFSAVARNQLQALQGAVAFYLPSLLLSGFLFPFQSMPTWARVIGEAMPLTHYLRATRAIVLRGAGPAEMLAEIGPIAAFTAIAFVQVLAAYRTRLD
jgi:ABC-2 type transport system permease protein